jgi:hypothetical protein
MNVEREQIRECVERLFDAEPCADELLGYIERSAPGLLYFIERKAAGRLSTGRDTFEKFLCSMPEPIFDHLFERALDFFRRPALRLEAAEALDPELASLAFVLWLDEQGLDTYRGTDGELYALMQRLAWLVVVEEQSRAGAGVWLAHSPMLLRDGAVGPPRFPVIEWINPH